MKASSVAALARINRDFYARRAAEFSDTRRKPWPGWRRVVALARERLGPERISILDLGCGNGRFLSQLGAGFDPPGVPIEYLGIDASPPLLFLAARAANTARAAPGVAAARLVAADLVFSPLAGLEATKRFDLIVNFGLMHHVPSRRARAALLAASAERLREGGLMAVSFWQFGAEERFRRRFVPWGALEGGAVDAADLEEGDHLLAWGGEGAVRYCHFADPAEAGALVVELDLDPVSSFRDDGGSGGLNLYHVLSKPTRGS